jgi:LPXTG-motif cell wall-anchored protein
MFAMGHLQQAGTGTNNWLWYVILGLLVLVLVVWGLFRRVKMMQQEALYGPPASPNEPQEPQARREDDLKKIEGIGPKVEKVLKEAGVKSYDALSRANSGELQDVLKAAGLQMMNPDGWIEQAELAAKGDWEKLKKLQDELTGGRRK